jgi:hypothetical protein
MFHGHCRPDIFETWLSPHTLLGGHTSKNERQKLLKGII